ncbi:hypothetical protein [Caulobacter sp. SSI4214]|uniref:hypothetical protein n=1 Tax=Caulobacter sp. SSI4214 TaxID=2575739 RepID=UPI00143C6C9E|nr:hypothetical protein [Caulobacter sp. SSI4214]
MSQLDPRLSEFVEGCYRYAQAAGLATSTVSTLLFNDGKRLNALASGESDIGIGRLAQAEAKLTGLAAKIVLSGAA